MRPLLHTLPLSKKAVFASAVGAAMLALSLYGFWRWINDAPTLGNESDPGHLFSIAIMAIMPMALFIIIAVHVASGAGYMSSSRGFQSRIDQLQKRLNEQDDFFRLVTDYTPTALTVFNEENESLLSG